MAKKNQVNPIAGYSGTTLDLAKFNLENEKRQFEIIEELLKSIYQSHLNVTRKHILKVIKLTWNIKDDYIYLPHNLKVFKKDLQLIFTIEKKKKISNGWLIFVIWLFIFALVGATYSGVIYSKIARLNKDIDGDGIADINIDINNDRIADINVDTNNDNKPDLNIDYKGNRRAVFNIDLNKDGVADSNFVKKLVDNDYASCNINCDITDDGWPDINLDLDGDGIRDTDIDTDNDGIPDLNLDVNGDGVCDIMCDTDGDELCDENCIHTSEPGKQNGSSAATGDPNVEASTPLLLINYVDGITVNVHDLMPDDQNDIISQPQEKPRKTFTVENMSDYPIIYSLRWVVVYNTFISDNFQYKVDSTNGGYNFGYVSAPKANAYIIRNITIPARVTQKYTFSFNLKGTGQVQNEDQGRVFQGYVTVDL